MTNVGNDDPLQRLVTNQCQSVEVPLSFNSEQGIRTPCLRRARLRARGTILPLEGSVANLAGGGIPGIWTPVG